VTAIGPSLTLGAAGQGGHAITGVNVAELVFAGILFLFGIRSLVKWLRVPYRPQTPGEGVLYALHATARVAMWLAFAGFFAGYALVDEPQAFRPYVMVPLGLAAIQLLTAMRLGMGKAPRPGPDGGAPS
jgi:hypothetical protein